MIKRIVTSVSFLCLLASASGVTIQTGIGHLVDRNDDPLSSGIAFVVVSTDGPGSGFVDPRVGDSTSPGDFLGGSDDIVLGTIAISDSFFAGEKALTQNVRFSGDTGGQDIKYEGALASVSEGDPLQIIFFDRDIGGGPVLSTDRFGVISTDLGGASFSAPSDSVPSVSLDNFDFGSPADFAASMAPVPEPSSSLLALIGAAFFVGRRRR